MTEGEPARLGDVCLRSVRARLVEYDENVGGERPRSPAFQDRHGEPSVDLASRLTELGLGPLAILEYLEGEQVWGVPAATVTALGMTVRTCTSHRNAHPSRARGHHHASGVGHAATAPCDP